MEECRFDEYGQKNTGVRVRVVYQRDSDKRLNPWEITHFISRITTQMYKVEMVNTIAAALSCGIDKKNIFVLDRAYQLNGNYRGCSELDLYSTGLSRLYSMGRPIAMEPNGELTEIGLFLDLLYDASQILRGAGIWRISARERWDAYDIFMQEGICGAINYIQELTEKRLRSYRSNEIKQREKIRKKMDAKCRDADNGYRQFASDRNYFEAVSDKLDAGEYGRLSSEEHKIADRYYRKFYQFLSNSARPVAGIYDKERCVMRILCADHLDENLDKHTKIDLKCITQNSPIMAEIEAGCQIFALRKEEKRKEELFKLEQRNKLLEQEKLRTEIEILNEEKKKKRMDTLSSALMLMKQADALADEEESRGIKALAESYAKAQLGNVYEKTQIGYEDILHKYNFRETEVRMIDLKV